MTTPEPAHAPGSIDPRNTPPSGAPGRWRSTLVPAGVLLGLLLVGLSSALISAPGETIQPGAIAALGDSITYGYPDPATGWVLALGIVDFGVPGDRTDQMLRRLPEVLAIPRRLVLIMGGTNDLSAGVARRAIVGNLAQIVGAVRAAGSRPVLMTIAPRADPRWTDRTDALNAGIRELATSEGVPLIDVHAVLAGPDGTYRPGLSIDGVHPSPGGYAAMASLIGRALPSLLP